LAVRMSDSLNYQKGLADGYRNLGDSYYVTDSLFPTMTNYLNAVRIYEQIDPSIELANIYRRLAFLNNYTGRDKSAIEYFLKAIEVLKKIRRIDNIYENYHAIAFTYNKMRKPDSALYYNKIALLHADSSTFYQCCNNFGIIYGYQFFDTGDTSLLDKSIKWFLEGLNSPEIDNHFKAAMHSNLYVRYTRYGKEEMDSLALSHLKQVLPFARNSKDAFYLIPVNYYYRGRYMERHGNYDSAIIYFNKSLDIIDKGIIIER